MEHVQIPVETLRRAADVLLTHLESVEGPVISLAEDLFWAIPPASGASTVEVIDGV